MDYLVRRTIEEGIDPIKAIQMATINTAEHFRVDEELGSISPGKFADVLMVDDLKRFDVEKVVADGELVAANCKLLIEFPKPSYPDFVRATMKLKPVRPEDFEVKAPVRGGTVKVRAIRLTEGQSITEQKIVSLRAECGLVEPNPTKDITRVAVIERHHRTGNLSRGFVQGFGMWEGAIASSVGHDAHNLTVVGLYVQDMAAAANAVVRAGGGQVVVKRKKILAKLELPIVGLMSDEPAEIVSAKLKKIERAARSLGISLESSFMALSFLPLAVMPKLRITDKGLVDVEKFEFVDLFVS